eukprot:3441917-Amphidinium_carterae.2
MPEGFHGWSQRQFHVALLQLCLHSSHHVKVSGFVRETDGCLQALSDRTANVTEVLQCTVGVIAGCHCIASDVDQTVGIDM